MIRTIHSASQLSIYGAVSSWCIDLAEKMHGQTSTEVDRSISEEKDQLSKQLDPQEVVSLVGVFTQVDWPFFFFFAQNCRENPSGRCHDRTRLPCYYVVFHA